MSQPCDLDKVRTLFQYHRKIVMEYRKGKRKFKVKHLLQVYAEKIGLSVSTYHRRKKELITD